MGIFKSYLEDRNYSYMRVFSQMVWPWSSRAAISQRCPQQYEIFTDYLGALCKLMRRKRKHVWEALVHTSTSFLVLHMWKQMMRLQHHLRPTVSGVGAARGAVRDAGDGEEGGMKEEVQDGSLLSTGAEVAAVWHISPFLRGRHSAHTPIPLPSLL